MNKLYQSLIDIIVLNEIAKREGNDAARTPQLPGLGKAGDALLELMVNLQQLSDRADEWFLSKQRIKSWEERKSLGGQILHTYIQALENSKNPTLDEGYAEVEDAFIAELHLWLCEQLELGVQSKAFDGTGYNYLQGQLVKNLAEIHRTRWNCFNMSALSAHWAMSQTAEWLNLDSNYKAYRAVACSRGFLVNVGKEKLRLIYLTECANSPADRLCVNNFDLNKAMSIGNTETVKSPATALDVYNHFNNA